MNLVTSIKLKEKKKKTDKKKSKKLSPDRHTCSPITYTHNDKTSKL